MDEIEIKYELPDAENQCSVCLSIGRRLFPLRHYETVFRQLTSELAVYNSIPIENIRLCWECSAFLQRAVKFQQQAVKANEMLQSGQSYIFGSQSSLTTIILNDSHPHTIYINEFNTQTDIKTCERYSDDDDDNDDRSPPDDGVEVHGEDLKEEIVVENTEPQKKPKSNRWAKKRALQNKKPKFKIITEDKNCFRRVQIDDVEVRKCIKSERDSEYFKSKRFKCGNCVLVFENEDGVTKHNDVFHDKVTQYICDICTSNFKSKRQLSVHIRRHYRKFVCDICAYICYSKTHRDYHTQKLHRRLFQCVKCKLKFGSRKEFFKHYKDWHEKFICDYCGINFKMRYCIKDHIRKQHSPFECKPCNKKWARYNGLWLHNKTKHMVHNTAYCVECDRQYRDIYRYRWHIANSTKHTKHKKHRIPCPGCDKIFSKNIYMKDHYNLVHLKCYKYRCEQCDKNFIRNADLVKHTRRIHEGILPPKNKMCYICGRGFTTNKILTNHLRTHTGEKPHVCNICNARFAQSTALSAHARAIHHAASKSM